MNDGLNPGCCSAAKPCNFQKSFPRLLCDVCKISVLWAALEKIRTQQQRIAAATDMTRPAMREAATETCAEITATLGALQ